MWKVFLLANFFIYVANARGEGPEGLGQAFQPETIADTNFDELISAVNDEIFDNLDNSTKNPTLKPSHTPTRVPTFEPTRVPTFEPTRVPTFEPTRVPTFKPTRTPTLEPTNEVQDRCVGIVDWAIRVKYKMNDNVVYNGVRYTVKKTHTSRPGAKNTPDEKTALYTAGDQCMDSIVCYRVPDWTVGVRYIKNDNVVYDGVKYTVEKTHTSRSGANFAPDRRTAFYTAEDQCESSPPPDPCDGLDEWAVGVIYFKDVNVVYDGVKYTVKRIHLSRPGANFAPDRRTAFYTAEDQCESSP